MSQQPELTKEAFLALASQAVFDPADPHLDELFPDVKLMLERMAVLRQADVEGIEPPAFDPTDGWGV